MAAGLRAAAPAVRARLFDERRPEDVEVARQRDRPAGRDRRARRRRAALLPAARGAVGPGRRASPCDGLDRRYAGELANDLGNLVSRATAMVVRYRGGVVPGGRAALEPVARGVREQLDELRPDRCAGADLAARAVGQPLRRGAPPWALARSQDEPPTPALPRRDAVHARRRRARARACCCARSSPGRRRRCWRRSEIPAPSPGSGRGSGSCPRAPPSAQPPPLFPRARAMIDTHAHLELCDRPAEELVAAAAAAGVGRILTVGREQALELAERFATVWAIVGYHPQEACGGRRCRCAAPAACAPTGGGGRRVRARPLPRLRPA